MITITIPESHDMWDQENDCFVDAKGYSLQLEHSLISIQQWESKYHKPFLSTEKNNVELIDYIKCMTINKGIPDEAYLRIPLSEMQRINDYIQDPMTATKIYEIGKRKSKGGRKGSGVVTAEKIYYWMISCNIPSEYRKWHLNQLMTLIQVFDVEGDTNNKMSPNEAREWQKAQNAARRKALHTKG